MNRISLSFAAAALVALGAVPAFAAEPSGMWINAERDTKIKVSKCGPGLCGSVAWLGKPNDAEGKPKTDRHNADASKRGRKLLGVPVLIGMKADGPDKWSGQIYNADDGKIYKSYITLAGDSTMNVQGCVLGGLFCKSMTWTRSN
jgi:uncharacterized protein (DUF2147 family)